MSELSPTKPIKFSDIKKSLSTLPNTYLLDNLPTNIKNSTSLACGLRRLIKSYTGPVVRVRRDSDNAYEDFYADESSNLTNASGTSYIDWLGTAKGYIMKMYDQSGSGKDICQGMYVWQPELSTTKAYPPSGLTADTTILSGNRYGNGTYTASASSSHSAFLPNLAFNNIISGGDFWHSVHNTYNDATGEYAGTVTTVAQGITYSGEWLQLNLPNTVNLRTFSITPRQDSDWDRRSPRSFVLLGSNDGTTWNLLHEETNINNWTQATKTFSVGVSRNMNYNIFRIVTRRIGNFDSSSVQSSVLIANMIFNGLSDPEIIYDGSDYLDTQETFSYPPAPLTTDNQTVVMAFPPNMYSNTDTIDSQTYIATASSLHELVSPLYGIFQDSITSFWHSEINRYNDSTGAYTGGVSTIAGGVTYSGEWVQIQLPTAIKLHTYTMMSRELWPQRAPSSFAILGSNDGTSWTLVDDRTGVTTWADRLQLTFSPNSSTAYSYFRLVARINGSTGSGRNTTNIAQWRLFTNSVGTLSPPSAMTANTTVLSGQMYVASASSENDSGGAAWRAFDNTTTGTTYWICSPNNYNSTTGAYVGTRTLGGVSGEWLKIQLPSAVILQNYTIHPMTDVSTASINAKAYKLLGSNDDANWTLLDDRTGSRALSNWSGNTTARTFSVSLLQAYRYFAIVVTVVGDTGAANRTQAAISQLQLITTPISNSHKTSGTYSVNASTVNASFLPSLAFDNLSAGQNFWHSLGSWNPTTGVYTGSESTTAQNKTYLGEWLQIKLPKAINLGSFAITPRQDGDWVRRSPRSFVLLGSRDGVSWNVVDEETNVNDWTNATKTFTVNVSGNHFYDHFRIVVRRVGNVDSDANATQSSVQIAEMKFFESVMPLAAGDDTYTYVADWTPFNMTNNSSIIEQNSNTLTNNKRASLLKSLTSTYGFTGWGNDALLIVPCTSNSNRKTVMNCQHTNSALNVQIVDNGTVYNGTTTGPSSLDVGVDCFFIGRRLGFDDFHTGTINEVIIFRNTVPLDASLMYTSGYVTSKVNLPDPTPDFWVDFHPKDSTALHNNLGLFTDAACDISMLQTLANNTAVASWNGYAQGTAGNRPVYFNSGGYTNEHGFVRFNRANSQHINGGSKTLNIATNGGFTAVAIVKFTGTAGFWERIFDFNSGLPNNNILFTRNNTTTNLTCEVFNGTTYLGQITATNVIVQDEWAIFAVRYDAQTRLTEIFKNGILVGSGTLTSGITDRTLSSTFIGRSPWTAHAYFNGDISGVYVIDKYLSDSEMSAVTAQLSYPLLPARLPNYNNNLIKTRGYVLYDQQKSTFTAKFDGTSNSFIDMPQTQGGPVTLALWFKPQQSTSLQHILTLTDRTRSTIDYTVGSQFPVTSGLVGHYNGDSWTGSQWTDLSGSGNHVTDFSGTIESTTLHNRKFIYGNSINDGILFPNILASSYTLFHITRYYNATVKQRIFTGYQNNWLSGHHLGNTGKAYHTAWITESSGSRFTQDAWVFSTSQNNTYRGQGIDLKVGTNNGLTTRLTINRNQTSAAENTNGWAVAEVIIFNRTLSLTEVQQMESYLFDKYTLFWDSYVTNDKPVYSQEYPQGTYLSNATSITTGSALNGLIIEYGELSNLLSVIVPTASEPISFSNVVPNKWHHLAVNYNPTTTVQAAAGHPIAFNADYNYTSSSGTASSAFDRSTNSWVSAAQLYKTSYVGSVSTLVDGNSILGEWIQLEVKNGLYNVTNYSTLYANDTRAPVDWYFVASNDNVNFVQIERVTGSFLGVTRNLNITKSYRYWRFIVTRTYGDNNGVCRITDLTITGRIGNGAVKLYLNGQYRQAVQGTTLMTNNSRLTIGSSSTYGFNGNISDFRIYNKAVRQEDISRMYIQDMKSQTFFSLPTNYALNLANWNNTYPRKLSGDYTIERRGFDRTLEFQLMEATVLNSSNVILYPDNLTSNQSFTATFDLEMLSAQGGSIVFYTNAKSENTSIQNNTNGVNIVFNSNNTISLLKNGVNVLTKPIKKWINTTTPNFINGLIYRLWINGSQWPVGIGYPFVEGVIVKSINDTNYSFGIGLLDNYIYTYTGYLKPLYAETYTFTLIVDDNFQMYINGQLMYSGGSGSFNYTFSSTDYISFEARTRDTGSAQRLAISWASASQASEVVPATAFYYDSNVLDPNWMNVCVQYNKKPKQTWVVNCDGDNLLTYDDPSVLDSSQTSNYSLVTDGLIAHFDPSDIRSYPGIGSTMYSLVGNLTAQLTGSYSYNGGIIRLTNNSTTSSRNVSCLQLNNSLSNIRTISIWYYQHSAVTTRHLLDLRAGVDGFIYNPGVGTFWTGKTFYKNGGSVQNINWANIETTGVWQNVTLVTSTAATDDITFFGRNNQIECLDVTFGPIFVYNRVITEAENTSNYNAVLNSGILTSWGFGGVSSSSSNSSYIRKLNVTYTPTVSNISDFIKNGFMQDKTSIGWKFSYLQNVSNENIQGLVPGLTWKAYDNYYMTDITLFDSNDFIECGLTNSLQNINDATNGRHGWSGGTSSIGEPFSVEWFGYFRANKTGNWSFHLVSDDTSYIWFGNNALAGYTTANAFVSDINIAEDTATISLVEGTYYPIRIRFGDGGGGESFRLEFTPPGSTRIFDGTGLFFSSTGLNPDFPAESAKVIKAISGTNEDGVYYINCNGVSTATYCLMNDTYDGGGWMMMMKGTQGTTFNYDSTHWTTTSTLNPTNANRDDGDAKYDTFNYVPVKDVLAVFPDVTGPGSISVRFKADATYLTFYDAIAPGSDVTWNNTDGDEFLRFLKQNNYDVTVSINGTPVQIYALQARGNDGNSFVQLRAKTLAGANVSTSTLTSVNANLTITPVGTPLSGSLTIPDGWCWKLDNWNGDSRVTGLSGFQTSRDASPSNPYLFSGYNGTVWSHIVGGASRHIIGGGTHISATSGTGGAVNARWGFVFNGENDFATIDTWCGIGLNGSHTAGAINYSAGDYGWATQVARGGLRRLMRFELFGR